jgi:four helix bundle protein
LNQESNIAKRTFDFSIEIIKLIGKANLPFEYKPIGSQLLRAGTSIGANVEEAQAAESKADFVHKYNIALKEARETKYWLKLLLAIQSQCVEVKSLIQESDEICKILGRIVVNSRKNI